jgi:hypothetical protein
MLIRQSGRKPTMPTPSINRAMRHAALAKRRDTLEERNIDSVEYATLQWLDWFNNRRLLEPI